jgi:hypothetical protein
MSRFSGPLGRPRVALEAVEVQELMYHAPQTSRRPVLPRPKVLPGKTRPDKVANKQAGQQNTKTRNSK